VSPARHPRELGARPASSRRSAALALALLVVVAAGAAWLLRGGERAPVAPQASVRPEAGARAGPGELADSPEAPPAGRSDAAAGVPELAPVELVVRLVERPPGDPRGDVARPGPRGLAGLRATWDGEHAAVSDAEGLLHFERLAPRAGELRVEAPAGLLGWSGRLDLAHPGGGLRRTGRRLTYELELRPDLGRFAGRVVDAAGLAVADAWVALARAAGGARRSSADADLLAPPTRTDGEGRFELPIVRDDARLELLVVAEGPGRPLGHVRALDAQEASGARRVDVELPPARRAHVRVLDAGGAPARGRVVLQRDGALWPAENEPRLAHTAVADGARAVPRSPGELDVALADGAWVVHYLPDEPGRPRTLFQFALGPQSGAEFEFRLADRGPPAVPQRD